MMIGPSAPNGPPVPIDSADEGADYTDAHRHEGNDQNARIGGEIPAVCVGNGRHVWGNLVEVGRFLVLLAPAIPLFGTVDFVGGSFEPLSDWGLGIRDSDRDLVLVALATHRPIPMRSRICRAW